MKTPHSFALVNLKPLLPGHVLVCPLRPHKRLTDLTPPELTDLFLAVQRTQHMLARHYFQPGFSPNSSAAATETDTAKITAAATTTATASSPPPPEAGSFNIAIQDGAEAGQTVPHVHVHVVPRIRGSTAREGVEGPGDDLYDGMAAEAGNVGGALWDREEAATAAAMEEEGRRRQTPKTRPVPGGGFPRVEDAERAARSMEEMEAEAELFRRVLREMEKEGQGL